jgi:hypothetical protein
MIVELNLRNIKDINKPNESFTIFGKIVPEYKNNNWFFTEELFDKPYEYKYPIDEEDYTDLRVVNS